jgi:hypothetical protein
LGCTVDADREIGRLREEHAPARPDLAWLWSITVMGPARNRGMKTVGRAPTFEAAKTSSPQPGMRSRWSARN